MSQFLAYSTAGTIIFCMGLYGLISRPHLLRKIVSVNIMGGGIFLFLISVGRRNFDEIPDPVPHAMLLTGIVVALSATAFAISLARRIYTLTGRTTLGEAEDAE